MGALADKYRAKPSLAAKYRVTPADTTDPLPAPEENALDALKPERPLGATMQGIVQGGTLRFGDEIMGAIDTREEMAKRMRQAVGTEAPDVTEATPAVNPNTPEIRKSWGPSQPAGTKPEIPEDTTPTPKPGLADTYRSLRDRYRDDNKTAQKAHPALHAVGEVAGGTGIPIPGAGLMKGAPLVAKMGLGAAQAGGLGAAYSLGGSEKEDFGEMRDDAIKDAALTAPAGVAGAVVGHVGGKLAERFGGAAQKASSRADDLVERDAMKLYKRATGSLGGEVTAGRNADEVMAEIIASPAATAEQKAAAQSLVNDPARLKMVQRVYDNAIRGFPARMDSMVKAEQGVQEAAAKNTPEALAAAREELLANPIRKRVLPSLVDRAKRHIIPAVGTGLGLTAAHLTGIDPVYGLAAGHLFGKTSKQLLSHPSVQKLIFGALESSTSGLSRAIAKTGMTIAAEASTEEKLRVLEEAATKSAEVAQAIKEAAGGDEPKQSKPKSLADRFGG